MTRIGAIHRDLEHERISDRAANVVRPVVELCLSAGSCSHLCENILEIRLPAAPAVCSNRGGIGSVIDRAR